MRRLAIHLRASQAARREALKIRAAVAEANQQARISDHLELLATSDTSQSLRHSRFVRSYRAGPETQARLLDELRWFPAPDRLLPTRLGNTLRSIEDNAGQRYGLNTITVWPRLYPTLSEPLRDQANRARDDYDTAARLCAGLALLAVVFAALLLPAGGWWRLAPVVLATFSFIAYRAACSGARYYGLVVYTAFDLHRFDLLVRLRLDLPERPVDELHVNRRISDFLAQATSGVVLPGRYTRPEPPTGA
jgi:hypothetical protein